MRSRAPYSVGAVALLAALAWAASSTNYTLDPVVIDDGGEIAASTNYSLLGSINGAAFASDITGGNQNGTASSTNYVTIVGFPESANPAPTSASGALISLGSNNPGASNELRTTTAALPMLQLVVSAGAGGAITLNAITVTASGSGNDAAPATGNVSGVDIYTDLNGNGVVDGSDATIATQQVFSGDNGTATFTPSTGIPINAGASATYLVVYTFAGAATAGDTFTANVQVGGMNITDASAQPVIPNGLPIAGGTKTMVTAGATPGTLTLSIGPASPGGTPVAANTTGAPWLQFVASASTVETVTINSIRFTASGTLNDALHVSAVSLYLDAGTPGVFDAADTALGAGTYSGNDGTVNFASLSQLVGAGASATFLVTYNVAPAATAGATAACTIALQADVGTTGGSSGGPVNVAGTPVGAVRTIQVALPTVVTTPGSSGGGGCAMMAPGTALPAGHPLGVLLPWLLGLVALLSIRRRTA